MANSRSVAQPAVTSAAVLQYALQSCPNPSRASLSEPLHAHAANSRELGRRKSTFRKL
jgi:hypothetical protein